MFASLTPCRYVSTVTALCALTDASDGVWSSFALLSGRQTSTGTNDLTSFICLTGVKRMPGPSSRIIDLARPYAASGDAAVQILRPGMPITYAWNGCECSAPSAWLGAVPPAPMIVIGILNWPPVVAYVLPADEISAMP